MDHDVHIDLSARPLAPYIVGRNVVAGAHFTTMKPLLADYFGVEGGLLVTEVMDGLSLTWKLPVAANEHANWSSHTYTQ